MRGKIRLSSILKIVIHDVSVAIFVCMGIAVLLMLVLPQPVFAEGTFISAPNRVDMVYDDARDTLYITSGGNVLRYQVSSNSFLTPFELGGSLSGIDLSPDGNTLAVADRGGSWIYLIDLVTGQSKQALFSPASGEGGTFTVAFGNDGAILTTSTYKGSGWVPLRRYVPATGQATVLASICQNTMLCPSADRSVIGFAESNISDGRFGRYRVADGNLLRRDGYTYGTSYFNYEMGVHRNGLQYAIPTAGGTFIYSTDLIHYATVGSYPGQGPMGVTYHPTADIVFFAWADTTKVYVYDSTKLISPIDEYDFENTFDWPGNHAFVEGRLKMSGDGSLLFATVEGGVRYVSTLPDTTAPTVISTYPADLTNNVPISASITATFSESMDPSTIDETTFSVKDGSGDPISGSVTYDHETRTATFDPPSNLAHSTAYTAEISTGVQDSAANNMEAAKVWSFTARPVDSVAPTAPHNLLASSVSSSRINLVWDGSSDSGGAGLAGYKIERAWDNSGAPGSFEEIASSASESYSDTGLNSDTKYWYRIRAYDNDGNHSDYSNLASTTTLFSPFAPALSSISPNKQVNDTTILVTITGFNFIPTPIVKIGTTVAEDVAFIDSNRLKATIPAYSINIGTHDVTVINPGGESAALPNAFTVVLHAPWKIQNLTAIDPGVGGTLDLSWGVDGVATWYNVYRSTSPGQETYLTTTSKATYRDTSLVNGQRYYYKISGINSGGEGPLSSEVSAMPTGPSEPDPDLKILQDSAWYFAEGYTGPGFQEWLCLQNPNDYPVGVTIQYQYRGGGNTTQHLIIGARTRETVDVNAVVGSNKEVSAVVTSDDFIIAERPMYFSFNGLSGGHNAVGAEGPSTIWYFAEGYTGAGFQEWLTLLNPNSSPANVTVTYAFRDGGTQVQTTYVGANTRETVDVKGAVGPNKEVSMKVEADQPIVAERPMYFSFNGRDGGHNVVGATSASTTWYFAEGYTGDGFQEYLTLQNPNAAPANVTIEYGRRGGGGRTQNLTVGANTRETVDVNAVVGSGKEVSVKMSSDQPIIAERPMYFDLFGATGGHDVVGATNPYSIWYFAEGYTGPGFRQWFCLQNPNSTPANVAIVYLSRNGWIDIQNVTIGANTRETIDAREFVGCNEEISAIVMSDEDKPIIAERPMYFNFNGIKGGHDVVGY